MWHLFQNTHPNMGALEVQTAAEELQVHPTFIREVMSDMLQEEGLRRGIPTPNQIPSKPIEITFEHTQPHVDPLAHECVDDTLERLKRVTNAPVEKFLRKKEQRIAAALGLMDPHNPKGPDEYEWEQVDHHMEAAWIGWGTLSVRVTGKRQMQMHLPLAALRRALALCPEDVLKEQAIYLELPAEKMEEPPPKEDFQQIKKGVARGVDP
jgi:hypothetical protein